MRSSRILQSSRTVFGGTPLSLNTTTFQYFLDPSISLSPDFDFVSIDLSAYGVPWNSFLYQEPLPLSWQARLDTTVAAVETWQLPIFLQLGILGGKSCPPQNASDVPGTDIPSVTNFDGCSTCFDYDIYRNPVASFIRQVRRWIESYTPIGLINDFASAPASRRCAVADSRTTPPVLNHNRRAGIRQLRPGGYAGLQRHQRARASQLRCVPDRC